MRREWHLPRTNRTKTVALARALGIPPLVAQILLVRGVDTPDAAKRFLNPAMEHVSDPLLLTDMEAAIERIHRALERQERVLVYGDYDVDGVAGTALLTRALRRFGIRECSYDVPNRFTEGFGLSVERVRQAHADGVSLIITVDNGSAARDAAQTARELGIDLVVTDHHPTEGPLPKAAAVVNSAREVPGHVSANACGVAIAYKLGWALTGEMTDLDLVALGTIADVVPLIGENRDLVAAGLEWAARRPRVGLEALAHVSGVSLTDLKAEDVAYHLAPRLNAAGRLATAHTALELLLTDSPSDALHIARQLDEANAQRRALEAEILEEAERRVENELPPGARSIVLGSRTWHPGLLGIVAARLQSRYSLPTVLVVFGEDGFGRGSARSVEGLNIAKALATCQDCLIASGGHKAAAGVTLHESALETFRQRFEETVSAVLPESPPPAPLAIDAVVSMSEIDGRLIRMLDRLAPFGHGNPPPVFLSQNVRVLPNSCREMRGGHIRFVVQEGPRLFAAVGFRMSGRLGEAAQAQTMDLAFTPQLNSWRGEMSVQLRVRDFRTASAA